MKKSWKRKYFILYHTPEDVDNVNLASYDKEEGWHRESPKKVLALYPRYRIAKRSNVKGREHVLEVDNENEVWYLAMTSSKMLDLWAIQIQMQTKLSRSISGEVLTVEVLVF